MYIKSQYLYNISCTIVQGRGFRFANKINKYSCTVENNIGTYRFFFLTLSMSNISQLSLCEYYFYRRITGDAYYMSENLMCKGLKVYFLYTWYGLIL